MGRFHLSWLLQYGGGFAPSEVALTSERAADERARADLVLGRAAGQ